VIERMGRKTKVFLSMMMSVTLIVCSMSNISIAEDTTSETTSEPTIVEELVNQRQLSVKQFELSDGTFKSVSYGTPVHYEDNGVMKEIDNRLYETTDTEDSDNESVYQTTENDFQVKISKNLKSNRLIKIKKDDYKIVWGIKNAEINASEIDIADFSSVNPEYTSFDENNQEVKDKIENLSDDDKKLIIPGLTSMITFKNIRENIDLQYVMDSSRVKENIVLKQNVANPKFTFVFKLTGLKAKLNVDKSLTFYDENDESKEIMIIPSPVMYDAAGAASEDIDVTLVETDTVGKYKYKIIPNNDWLADTQRQWPIVIDPSIETDKETINAHEVSVFPNGDQRTADTTGHFWVGMGKDTGLNRAYAKFDDVPVLTNAFEVTQAYFSASLYDLRNTHSQIDVYESLEDWDEDEIDWDNKPDYTNKQSSCLVSGAAGTRFTWDITAAAKKWCKSSSNNHGIMLKLASETGDVIYQFHSTNTTSSDTYKPLVVIHYGYKDGMKQYLGRVEAESMVSKSSSGVSLVASNYSSEGHYIKMTEKDAYIKLDVNSNRSGLYDGIIRVTSSSSGNIIKAIVNEGAADEYVTNIHITDTSESWQKIKVKLRLHNGVNTIKLLASEGSNWFIDYLEITPNLPDVVQAENFSFDSAGFADVQVFDSDEVRYIGEQAAGEYYEYKVNVQKAGQYRMNFKVASTSSSGKFDVCSVEDTDRTLISGVTVPSTGSSTTFTTVSKDVYLTKNVTKIKIKVTTGGWSFDSFECVQFGARTIQAEEYSSTSGAGTYLSENGEQYITTLDEGNYTAYTVILRKAGTYNLGLKVSSATTSGIIRVEDANGNTLARYIVPQTGGMINENRTWYDINNDIKLIAGVNTIKVYAESLNWDLEKLTLSHKMPGTIAAQDISDTNTAIVENSMVTLKESEYVDYNIWLNKAGKYTVGLENGDTSLSMNVNIEGQKGVVLGNVEVPAAQTVAKEVELKEGYTALRIYNKKGTGKLKTISIVDGDAAIEGTTELDKKVLNVKAMITKRSEHVLVVLNDKIYAMSGKNVHNEGMIKKCEVYNSKDDDWDSIKDIPTAVQGAVGEGYNENIFVIGGSNNDVKSAVQVYNIKNKTWTTKTSMPTKRAKMGSVLLDGKVYVVGGYDGDKYLNTVEVYDIATDSWTVKNNFPVKVQDVELEVLNGKIYAVGGKTEAGVLSSTYEYNLTADSWTEKKTLNVGRWGHTVISKDNKLYTIGGYNKSIVTSIEVYDPTTNLWSINIGLKNPRFNMAAGLLNNQIYVTGGQNYFSGGTLATNEVISETAFNNNNEVISSIDIITLTSEDSNSESESPVYFQAYKENGTGIYSGTNGTQLVTTGFEIGKSQRFSLTGNTSGTIGDLKSFKLTIDGTDGWKFKGFIVIVNNSRVVFSNLDINKWIDTDTASDEPFIERNFDKFINTEANRSQILSSSNVSVITTTSTDADSQTSDPVYMKLNSNSSEYELKNTVTGNFANGATDNFLDITGTSQIPSLDMLQLNLPGTNDWKVKSVIVMMNNKVVYYKENINDWLGDDGGHIWADAAINNQIWTEYGMDKNDESVNSIDIITLTAGTENSNTDSPVYFQASLKNGSGIYSGTNGLEIDTPANDLEANKSDRFHITGNKSCTIGDLKSFKLTIGDTDGWKIKGIIVLVNDNRVVYSNLNINTWIDTNSTDKEYIENDFDIFIDPVENRTNILPSSDVSVITTTATDTDSQTAGLVNVKFSSSATAYTLSNTLTGNFTNGATDNFLDITGTSQITAFDMLQLSLASADDYKIKSIIVTMNNKVVYYKDNVNIWLGNDTNPQWTGDWN
jgi:N-acetylneuraminic acid mutarotase